MKVEDYRGLLISLFSLASCFYTIYSVLKFPLKEQYKIVLINLSNLLTILAVSRYIML